MEDPIPQSNTAIPRLIPPIPALPNWKPALPNWKPTLTLHPKIPTQSSTSHRISIASR